MVGALLLIGIGIVLLLQNLGVIAGTTELVFGMLFAAGGAVFLAVFVANRQTNWWAIIPGLVLVAIGILIWAGRWIGPWGGTLMLGAIALAFLIIYLNQRQFWWAIIPAGVLLTLALLVGLSEIIPDLQAGETFVALFFLGIGLTFLAVYFVPTAEGRMKWAVWPAGVMLIMGVIFSLTTPSALNWIWALALIAGGGYLMYRAMRAPKT